MNTRGSSSFLDYFKVVVGSTGGVTITGSGLMFRVLASRDSIQSWGSSIGILRLRTSS